MLASSRRVPVVGSLLRVDVFSPSLSFDVYVLLSRMIGGLSFGGSV